MKILKKAFYSFVFLILIFGSAVFVETNKNSFLLEVSEKTSINKVEKISAQSTGEYSGRNGSSASSCIIANEYDYNQLLKDMNLGIAVNNVFFTDQDGSKNEVQNGIA